jgi:hypothetical protein
MIFGILFREAFENPFFAPFGLPAEKKRTTLKDNTLNNIIMCKVFYYI